MKMASVNQDFLEADQFSRPSRRIQDNLTIALFLLPAFAFFLVFLVYPILQSVYFSLFNWKGFGPAVNFIGLENYSRILNDHVFMIALRNGVLIVVLSLALQLPLSMALALMVGRNLPGRVFFRTVFFLPYVFSEVITGIIWYSMYRPDAQTGFFNALLTLIPGVQAQAFLGNPDTVLACIFVALTWKYFGFHMLLYMAGVQNISQEIEEAARIDGANGAQTLFYITLPLLASTIRTSVYLSVLGSLQQFGLVWIMTQGGPVSASETMATYLYRFAFVRFALGYGSAIAIVMLLICLAFSLVYQRLVQQPKYLGAF
jgi:raffinose/stachyose/melibiose transport system permease protein